MTNLHHDTMSRPMTDAGWQSEAVGFTAAQGSDMIGAVEKLTA